MITSQAPRSSLVVPIAREKQILTFSSLKVLRSCPRQYKLRFIDKLFPIEQDADVRYFGTIVHRALEVFYGQRAANSDDFELDCRLALDVIDEQCKGRDEKPDVKKMWHVARAMVSAYIGHYGKDESWKILEIEKEFTDRIVNPKTGAESRTFDMKGKVDLLLELTDHGEQDGLYIADHKTLSAWTEQEEDKLHMDTQMAVYVYYLRRQGFPVSEKTDVAGIGLFSGTGRLPLAESRLSRNDREKRHVEDRRNATGAFARSRRRSSAASPVVTKNRTIRSVQALAFRGRFRRAPEILHGRGNQGNGISPSTHDGQKDVLPDERDAEQCPKQASS